MLHVPAHCAQYCIKYKGCELEIQLGLFDGEKNKGKQSCETVSLNDSIWSYQFNGRAAGLSTLGNSRSCTLCQGRGQVATAVGQQQQGQHTHHGARSGSLITEGAQVPPAQTWRQQQKWPRADTHTHTSSHNCCNLKYIWQKEVGLKGGQ